MNIVKYQVEAATTAVYPEQFKYGYPALGVCDEAGELCEKLLDVPRDPDAILKELGDVMWYAAQTATDFEISLASCYNAVSPPSDCPDFGLMFSSARLAGRVKKILRGDDLEGKLDEIRCELGKIVRCVESIADILDTTLIEVCIMNLDKLFDRQERGVLTGDGDNR